MKKKFLAVLLACMIAASAVSAVVSADGEQAVSGPVVSDDVSVGDTGVDFEDGEFADEADGVVKTEDELRTAVAQEGSVITLGSDITLNSKLTVAQNVTINGAGYKLLANFSSVDSIIEINAGDKMVTISNIVLENITNAKHAINVYKSTNVTLDTITVKNLNSGLGLLVNASKVTATGDWLFENNVWGDNLLTANAINVGWGQNISDMQICEFDASSAKLNGVARIYTDHGDVERAGALSKFTVDLAGDYAQATLTDANNAMGYFAYMDRAVQDAVAGATVTLNQDIKGNYTIQEGQDITLDLNGYTLDGGTTAGKAALTNYGTVVIVDSGINGTIKRSDTSSSTSYYTIYNEGTMTIKDGNVCNNSGSETVWAGSSLICNGAYQNATLNIMGGTFGQDNFIAVKNDECGTLNISGGTITSKTQAVQNWCNANITGGTLTGSVTSWTYMSTQANTNISGGIINGDIQASQYNYTSKGQMVVAVNKPVVTLSGNVYMNGSFKIGVDTDDVFVEDLTAANVTITGGSYVNNPSVFLANGYVAVLSNGVYKVWDEDSLPVDPEVPEEPEEPEYPVYPEIPDYIPNYGSNSGSSSKPETSEPETEWKRDDDGNTYFYKDGEKVTGWVEEDGEWYYMNEDTGAMTEESWVKVNNVWYAFDDDGHMLTGWQEIDGKWYYLKDWGGMATGWQQVDGVWYYLKGDGAMATGWVQSNGQWYYLKGNGAMATGWVESNGKWYYLYESGEMATNATIGGYYVNSNGEWVK